MLFKHKYIKKSTITPKYAFIAAAINLSDALKNKMPHLLKESSIQELSRLQKIFSEATANNSIDQIRTEAEPHKLAT